MVAEDYSFPYTQVFGFMAEFCKAGAGRSKSWVPIGNKDFSSVIAAIPTAWTPSTSRSADRTPSTS